MTGKTHKKMFKNKYCRNLIVQNSTKKKNNPNEKKKPLIAFN